MYLAPPGASEPKTADNLVNNIKEQDSKGISIFYKSVRYQQPEIYWTISSADVINLYAFI